MMSGQLVFMFGNTKYHGITGTQITNIMNNALLKLTIMALTLSSYNIHGVNDTKWEYLNRIVADNDFVMLQETWLHDSQSHVVSDNLNGVCISHVSGMDSSTLTAGRPHGGCAIIWKNPMVCNVHPVSCDNKRLCMVNVVLPGYSLLLCTIYMPCDTTYDESNIIVYNGVLRDISIAANTLNINHIACGGDFNTDISRSNSLHTKSLMRFVQNEHMILLDDLPNNSVDYTFESKIDQTRSRGGSRIWQWGAKISSEASYIYERSELHIRAKRVTSEASINQLGIRGGGGGAL